MSLVRSLLLSGMVVSAVPLAAQRAVVVLDETGSPVPYAVVSIANGRAMMANERGRVMLRDAARDSLRLSVRRLGYREFKGWVHASDSTYVVSIEHLPQALGGVVVSATANTPLSRTGFYDRAERVQRGAIVGEFIPPEEVEARNQSLVSNLLQGHRYVRVSAMASSGRRRVVLLGRGGCAMTVVVDGQVAMNTLQDIATEETPTSISLEGTRPRRSERTVLDVDELVHGQAVVAVEIYPSTANAPVELVSLAGRGSCGIVAIWTGARQ